MKTTILKHIALIPILVVFFGSVAIADISNQTNLLWHNSSTGAIKFMSVNDMIQENTLTVVDSSNANLVPRGMGNFAGDSNPDILFHNQNSGNLRIWEMDGTTKVNNIQVLGSSNTNLEIAGIGDFDQDGDNDIATFNTNSGALRIWVMHGTVRVDNISVLTGANTNLAPRGVGDMDGDGIPDIVLRNNNSGAVRVWTMNADFTRKGNKYVTGSSNTNLELRGVMDINSDGNNDILNYNTNTGKLRAWLMDGNLKITENAEVTQISDLDWSVRGGENHQVQTTCINNYHEKSEPDSGFSLCIEDVNQAFCEEAADPDDTYDVNAIMIPWSCSGAGFPADSLDQSSNIYLVYEPFKGIEYAYQTGDIADETYLADIRQSLAVTSGAVVQAMLSINTFIFTNNATTSLDTFKARKTQVDQALDILEAKAGIVDGYLDMLSSPEQAQAYIAANYKTIDPAEVEAILNSSKIKGVLRPLMAHYHVSARKAKEILDNAMENLFTQYIEEANNYETATNVAKVVRDGAGLAITIGATVATAGTVGGLGVVGGISSLVQGADGIVKLSKSSAELIIGEDGALDDTYKHSALVGGLSAASEMLAIKSLFTRPDSVEGAISNLYYWSSKARELTQDEVIAFGPASLNYGDYIHYKPNRETYRRLLRNAYRGPVAYPTKGTYRRGTKVLVVDKKVLQKLVKKLLKVLPEDSQVQGTKDTLAEDETKLRSSCPKTLDTTSDSNVVIYGIYGKDYLRCSYHDNGTLFIENPYRNGKQNGVLKAYYESGILDVEHPYKDNKIDGIAKDYYLSGNIYTERSYKNGIRNGIGKEFYESGKIMKIVDSFVNGVLNGTISFYKESGCLSWVEYWVNDESVNLKTYNDCE